MFSVEKISVAYATPTPPASWRYCAPLSSLWCAAPATIHSKSPKRSSLMIPTKPSGYSVPDALSEWSVKFWIGAPLMNLVRRRQMARQLGQVAAFMLEGFGRNQPALALGPVLHAHRSPFKGLAVEIVEALKRASGQKVGLDSPEAALFTGFAI